MLKVSVTSTVKKSNVFSSKQKIEEEVIDFLVALARLLGQPRSIAEIYGLLFVSRKPLSMIDIISHLNLSKGSASQGLRFLKDLGAIRSISIDGERREYFVAETVLKKMVSGFIRGELIPHLKSGQERLDKMESLLGGIEEEDTFYAERIERLKSWYKRGRQLLPVLERFLAL